MQHEDLDKLIEVYKSIHLPKELIERLISKEDLTDK